MQSIADVLGGLLRDPAMSRGMAVGRLAGSWTSVVGGRLAHETTPVRLEGGTLVVGASDGAWAAQARFLAGEIRREANRALGSDDVERVQVIVLPEGRKPL